MEDYNKEPDQLPLEAVLALELIRYQFVRTLELIKKYDIEDRVEDWASGELKDFILYIKQLYKPGGMLKYNFEEFLAHSIEGYVLIHNLECLDLHIRMSVSLTIQILGVPGSARFTLKIHISGHSPIQIPTLL
tara:strand:+ start:291 stop:689 length:399 start_codon:yes stop_codon:yes gene_type:complete